ncbi:MAG TPA: DUF6491 family protein [Caulobacterales bacterium]|nr:DUF6491 family protein [Caulobacterales bacterium]
MRSLTLFLAAAVGAVALASCATEPSGPPPQFTVLEPNASVSLHDVEVRSWGKDDSILLQTNRRQWYRAVISGGCTHAGDLLRGIGFETQTGDLVDRGSFAIVGGQRCLVTSVDKIADPPAGSRW